MMKTKPVATTLLVVMAIIFLIAYPQRQDTFWAFIMHVSGAAMIGGLADWYAVTALFTKPLGIPFKTAILPKYSEAGCFGCIFLFTCEKCIRYI